MLRCNREGNGMDAKEVEDQLLLCGRDPMTRVRHKQGKEKRSTGSIRAAWIFGLMNGSCKNPS